VKSLNGLQVRDDRNSSLTFDTGSAVGCLMYYVAVLLLVAASVAMQCSI
jgi:hypothetical protein